MFQVHGRGNFPTLEITLQNLVKHVHNKLTTAHIPVNDVRINGGFAGYILADSHCNRLSYNDVDIIFSVQLQNEDALLKIKDLVADCLLEYYLPEVKNRDRLSVPALTDAYVSKLTKVWQPNGDKWSLIALSNNDGMSLELKFVDTMKRKFQFSVDSFQIILDSLMRFYDISSEQMTKDFYPSVVAESMYGDFAEALSHLNGKLIATHSPQEIRGGGLLKYCDLLSRGYQPAYSISEIEKLERLMCSRFFIDYSDISSQCQKLHSYLTNHFGGNFEAMLRYLYELYRVVNDSTVCLMGHERRQALDLIQQTGFSVQFELQRQLEYDYGNMAHTAYITGDDELPDTCYYMPPQASYVPVYGYPGVQGVY